MKRPVNVLVVEDNPADIRLLQEALRQWPTPVELHVETDGDSAVNSICGSAATLPDLIILDLNLRETSGYEVLKAIRSDDRTRAMPVIVFSASGAENDVKRAYDDRANCYVRKPTDLDGFFEAVRVIQRFWLTTVELPPVG